MGLSIEIGRGPDEKKPGAHQNRDELILFSAFDHTATVLHFLKTGLSALSHSWGMDAPWFLWGAVLPGDRPVGAKTQN